jgi:hypothetical protein
MRFAKENPIFTAFLGVCLIVFLAGVVLATLEWLAAGQARERLESAEQRVNAALAAETAPTPENVRRAEANIERLRENEERLLNAIAAKGSLETAPPNLQGPVLVDILQRTLPRRLRALATSESGENVEIAVPEQFRFSFDRYVGGEWPPQAVADDEEAERELIEDLYVQQQVVAYLVRKLFEAAPETWQAEVDEAQVEPFPLQLVALERESVLPETERRRGGSPRRSDAGLFEIDEAISAETDRIGTIGFRITFDSYSQTLRAFMNDLANYEIPVVVRSVEVTPARGSATRGPAADVDFGDEFFGDEEGEDEEVEQVLDPVVEQNVSRFVVTLEYIELKEAGPAEGDDAPLVANQP